MKLLRASRQNNRRFFPCGAFFPVLQVKAYWSALIPRKLPCPKKFLVTRLILMHDQILWFVCFDRHVENRHMLSAKLSLGKSTNLWIHCFAGETFSMFRWSSRFTKICENLRVNDSFNTLERVTSRVKVLHYLNQT